MKSGFHRPDFHGRPATAEEHSQYSEFQFQNVSFYGFACFYVFASCFSTI